MTMQGSPQTKTTQEKEKGGQNPPAWPDQEPVLRQVIGSS